MRRRSTANICQAGLEKTRSSAMAGNVGIASVILADVSNVSSRGCVVNSAASVSHNARRLLRTARRLFRAGSLVSRVRSSRRSGPGHDSSDTTTVSSTRICPISWSHSTSGTRKLATKLGPMTVLRRTTAGEALETPSATRNVQSARSAEWQHASRPRSHKTRYCVTATLGSSGSRSNGHIPDCCCCCCCSSSGVRTRLPDMSYVNKAFRTQPKDAA